MKPVGIPTYYMPAVRAERTMLSQVAAGHFTAASQAASQLGPRYKEWMTAWKHPFDYARPTRETLGEWHRASSFDRGLRWNAFDTTSYHYPHPDPLPGFPGVACDAKAVVLAFPGSGLNSSGGRNFMALANALQRRNVSLVSFDYPFHRDGPLHWEGRINPNYLNASVFHALMAMGIAKFLKSSDDPFVSLDASSHGDGLLRRKGPIDPKYLNADVFHGTMAMGLAQFYKSSGIPLFLMGHSQGPLPIQELLWMDPYLASGALLFSPGGAVSRELLEYYRRQDARGAFVVTSQEDPVAEAWEMAMDEQARTTDLKRMPTPIPVWAIAGELDAWSTPKLIRALAAKYPSGRAEIVPDVGHAIFHARLPNGKSLMASRIVEMIEGVLGEKLPNGPKKMSASSKVLHSYHNSELFRSWFAAVETHALEDIVVDAKQSSDLLERWYYWLTSAVFEATAPALPAVHPGLRKLRAMLSAERNAEKSALTRNTVSQTLGLLASERGSAEEVGG